MTETTICMPQVEKYLGWLSQNLSHLEHLLQDKGLLEDADVSLALTRTKANLSHVWPLNAPRLFLMEKPEEPTPVKGPKLADDWLIDMIRHTPVLMPHRPERDMTNIEGLLHEVHIYGSCRLPGGTLMSMIGQSPFSKEGVGVSFIHTFDGQILARQAESIQGVHLDEATKAVVDDFVAYMDQHTAVMGGEA